MRYVTWDLIGVAFLYATITTAPYFLALWRAAP